MASFSSPFSGSSAFPARKNIGTLAVFRKELADHLNSKRFGILFLLVAITGLASIYVAAQGIRSAVAQYGSEFVFLRLFTSSGSSLPPFISFVSFLGPLVGLAMGFDAINGEKARRTLSRLLAQPIHRDAVINGKFWASTFILGMMVLTLGFVVAGLGLVMAGVPPSGEEFGRMLVYLVLSIVYIAFWLSLSQLFSVVFKQTATSALASIAVWLFLAIFTALLAGLIADGLFPVNDQSSTAAILQNQVWHQDLSRISPAVLYDEAVTTILNPGIRTLGPVLMEQVQGAVPGTLPLAQSLLLIWPHLTGLAAATMICFALSYIFFMRQEIRA